METPENTPPEATTTTEIVPVVTQDAKNLTLLLWLGTLFFGFIPGLLMYLLKKDDNYVIDQSKEALNWSITALIGYAAGSVLTIVLIGFLILPVVAICHVVFCIMGMIGASNGKTFRVPYALRLIK